MFLLSYLQKNPRSFPSSYLSHFHTKEDETKRHCISNGLLEDYLRLHGLVIIQRLHQLLCQPFLLVYEPLSDQAMVLLPSQRLQGRHSRRVRRTVAPVLGSGGSTTTRNPTTVGHGVRRPDTLRRGFRGTHIVLDRNQSSNRGRSRDHDRRLRPGRGRVSSTDLSRLTLPLVFPPPRRTLSSNRTSRTDLAIRRGVEGLIRHRMTTIHPRRTLRRTNAIFVVTIQLEWVLDGTMATLEHGELRLEESGQHSRKERERALPTLRVRHLVSRTTSHNFVNFSSRSRSFFSNASILFSPCRNAWRNMSISTISWSWFCWHWWASIVACPATFLILLFNFSS
jgi:hypothetical protein